MSDLTDIDKRYLEKILGMQSGFVLDYSDPTFGELFNRHNINIHSQNYQTYGTSKAKKMRSFWKKEPNKLVAQVLTEMLDSYEADCDLNDKELDVPLLKKNREIISKLVGGPVPKNASYNEEDFLNKEFDIPNIDNLPIEMQVVPIIKMRLEEARRALNAKAYLSVIFLCGSVLEAVLLGAAQKQGEHFNKASASPKDKEGNVKRFNEWSLAQLIDAASEVSLLKPDIKKFSHGLRDFRNYIHPYEQMVSGFSPDEHTAKVCFQVLKAALANVAGNR